MSLAGLLDRLPVLLSYHGMSQLKNKGHHPDIMAYLRAYLRDHVPTDG
jgi:hypothetical protein